MRFSVYWHPSAEQQLTNIWLTAPDRTRVTEAASDLEARLCRDPENAGESREDGSRVAYVPPLGARFAVRNDDAAVVVVAVWYVRKRRRDGTQS